MVNSKTLKYAYETLEQALSMASAFEKLFKEEGVYISHSVTPIIDNKAILIFTIKTHNDTTSTS